MMESQSRQRLRVLVLDRNEERRLKVVAILRRDAGTPLTILAATVPEEIIPSRRPSFDVAILSLDEHEDVLARARELRRTHPDVPLIALGGEASEHDARALVEVGIQDHIPSRCASCPNRLRLMPSLRWAVERAHLLHSIQELRDESSYRALHDSLTGLPNRELFCDRLRQSLAQAGRRNECFAVLFLDLDHFKQVNDTLGHAIGDQLLGQVAQRLPSALRASDTIARWGGDEFALLSGGVESRADAARVARNILGAIEPPYRIGGHELSCHASVGISLYPTDGKSEQLLIRRADQAMYRAKADGGGGYRFFCEDPDPGKVRSSRGKLYPESRPGGSPRAQRGGGSR